MNVKVVNVYANLKKDLNAGDLDSFCMFETAENTFRDM